MYVGTHIAGQGRGKTMGFPTLNLSFKNEDIPYEGIFLVRVFFENNIRFGLLHCGTRPTFGVFDISVEIFILDFSENVPYGIEISFEILHYLRSIRTFASQQELIAQIQKDKEDAEKHIEYLQNDSSSMC